MGRSPTTGQSPRAADALPLRESAASGLTRRSWAQQAKISQVHRSVAAGLQIFGAVHPRTCLNRRKVCCRSKRRKNACQSQPASPGAVPVRENHSHADLGSRSPGRRSTCNLIRVPR